MRAFFILPLLALAAVGNAQVFKIVRPEGTSTVYGVRGAVTVGSTKLTGEKSALEYNGTIALQKLGEETYLAKFLEFTNGKYERTESDIEDEGFEQTTEHKLIRETTEEMKHEMLRPVKVFMKNGQVVRMEAEKDHKQWSLNVYRAVFTLLQNQVQQPNTLEVPHVEYMYEHGIHGNCKVQYELISEPEDETVPGVFNMTKTHNLKDCVGARPVYLHLKDTKRGCAGVCEEHMPENFLPEYEEEKSDYTMRPTPGCPVNGQRTDTLVTVHKIAKYNVSRGLLDEARTYSMDVYRLFGGELQVRTTLHLIIEGSHNEQIHEPTNVNTYNNLHFQLPEEEKNLDIPIYALMKEMKTDYVNSFNRHLDAVVRELVQFKNTDQKETENKEEEPRKTPAHIVELIQAISGMTYEEIKKTITPVVQRPQGKGLNPEELLHRQIWIEILGKAGSKSSVKIATELIKNNILTPTETRRVLQDITAFQSYTDTEMIEELLELCTGEHKLTSTGKATACVAAGKLISKGCRSEVTYTQKDQHQSEKKLWIQRGQQTTEDEQEDSMGRLAIEPELRCTVENLNKYIERLSKALQHTTEFKEVVAYINGLSKIEKPEVLRELIGFVNGTAPTLNQIHTKTETNNRETEHTREFVRKIAILSLGNVASKYPKEVNPIVRIIVQNVTENVQTRIIAFDIWMNTQPAQWEVEKMMQVANKDTSLELTHYIYTGLKTAMHAKEPCYQLLAKRIRDAWTQIRPFDLGMEFSHLRTKSYYDNLRDYGVRAIWKMVASNTTVLPTFSEYHMEQVRGPNFKTLLGAKLLVHGGDKIWEELVGKDGLLERISSALDGQIKQGERKEQREHLIKDIADSLNMKLDETSPKAVLFWKLFSGEAIIPIDGEYMTELKREIMETVQQFGKKGHVSGHFLRVFVPTKAFHVEPSSIGLPIVHSTIHPLVVFIRYENLGLTYENLEGRVVPEHFELTGTIQPTILSLRQSRVFVAQTPTEKVPTVKVSNIKEATLPFTFRVVYENNEQRFKLNIKPHFDRVYHSGHCTELNLHHNILIDNEPTTDGINYSRCVKNMMEPIVFNKQYNALGMSLKVDGYSHEQWAGLPILGSKQRVVASILERIANKGLKHETVSVYLQTDKQRPVNEWEIKLDGESNISKLVERSLSDKKMEKITVEKEDYEDKQLVQQLEKVISKVEQRMNEYDEETEDQVTLDKQMLVMLEGRYNGKPQRIVKLAMKNMLNLEKTEQGLAIALETGSGKMLEVFANVSYPKRGSPFHYDPIYISEDELLNGTIVAKINGQESNTFRVDFNATKSEEQREQHLEKREWFEKECMYDQEKGQDMTDACKKAILKDNSLDRMQLTLRLPENISPKMTELAHKVLNLIKYKLYPHMRSERLGREELKSTRGEERKIDISVNATRVSPWSLLYNVRVEMPRENMTLSNIRMRGLRPVHMQMTLKEQLQHVLFRGQKETPCVLGHSGVRTYDNVTFGLEVKPGCEYVLTRDCEGTYPDFTVTFAIVKPETGAKKIRTQLVNTIIELIPFTKQERDFHVVINGTEQRVTFDKPLIFEYTTDKKVFIHAYETSDVHAAPIVRVYTESKEIVIEYDGVSAQVFVDNKYKGVTCGVCGNNDNEKTHEFVGPNGKEFHTPAEFIASYGLTESCRIPHYHQEQKDQPRKHFDKYEQSEELKWDSSEEEMDYTRRSPNHDQSETDVDEGYLLKTNALVEDKLMCFSQEPVRVCRPGYKKVGIAQKMQVTYLCVEPQQPIVREAMKAVKRNEIFDTERLQPHVKITSGQIIAVPECRQY